jgi:peptidyl-prolyl cis-trans isomerase SurA
MDDVFNYFVREILLEVEKRSLERDYPDYLMQLQEYYDGILLFEISNKRVWSRPVEEQEQLEAEWIKEMNEKYPVTINWKAIRKIKRI